MATREQKDIESAIVALEAQRAALGDAVVDAALAALRDQLAAFAGPAIANPAKMVSEERKLVTVMFADISGFTAMSEKLDAEHVHSIMNSCFECLVPVINKYEGTVDKYIGDEIMALFGAPTAHEDDPERALRAALEMMEALSQFNTQRGTELGMHFGINTGPVIAGNVGAEGRKDYSVMGDAVNLAARLEDASDRGEILIGPETHRQTAALFEFEELSPLTLKGKADRVPVFKLLSLKSKPASVRGIAGFFSKVVGRDEEMSELAAAVYCVKRGRGSTFMIIGEAGIGKSRLLAEIRATIDESTSWIETRAQPYATTGNYGLFRDIFDGLIGVKSDASSSEIGAALRAGGREVSNASDEDVFPYIARLLGIPLDRPSEELIRHLTEDAFQKRLTRAVSEYLQVRTRAAPLVLVCEDVHWTDSSSLRLLQSLLPLCARLPLLWLLSLRPEHDRLAALQSAAQSCGEHYYRLDLKPITGAESRELITNLLKIDLPEKTCELILQRSDGNPFFIEEMLRSLIDTGSLVLQGNQVVSARDAESVSVPYTLQGVVTARMDRLPNICKQALQTAAVLGRSFQLPVLEEVLKQERWNGDLRSALLELESKDFIRLQQPDSLGPGKAPTFDYMFRHGVVQEVAYNSLLLSRGKQIHGSAAETIEKLFSDRLEELSAILAYHFDKAERSEEAAHYFRVAADSAASVYANAEAILLYDRAVEHIHRLLSDDADGKWKLVAAQLYERIGSVQELIGRHQDAREAYTKASKPAPTDDRIWQSRLHRLAGQTRQAERQSGCALQAWNLAEATLRLDSGTQDAAMWQEWIQIQLERLWTSYWMAQVEQMEALVEKTRPALERWGTPEQRGRFFFCLINARNRKSRYIVDEGTISLCQEYITAAENSGNLAETTRAHFLSGFSHLWGGQLAVAAEKLNSTLQLARKTGDSEFLTLALTYLTVLHRRRSDIESVRQYLQSASNAATSNNTVPYIAMAKANCAWIALREGDLRVAEQEACAAMELWKQLQAVYPFQWAALWPLVKVALEQDMLAAAIEHLRELLAPTQQKLPAELNTLAERCVQNWEPSHSHSSRERLRQLVELADELALS